MNETNSTEINEDVDFEHSQSDSEAGNSAKGGNTVFIILILLLILLAGGGGYWLYNQQQGIQINVDEKLQQYNDKITGLTSEIKEETSKVTEMTSSQQSSSQGLKSSLAELTSQQQLLQETLTSIQEKKPKQESDWVLAEVEYLLTIAQQRLSLERDAQSALAAMQGADNRLRDLANPNLNSVREQLVKEMNSLREIEDADISGMVLYLADVTSRVESLPLKDFEVPTMNTLKIPSKEEAAAGNWKEMMLSMWGDLVKMVEIKDQNVPDEILFDPEMRYFLQQNMQLELSSAKLSVLRRDTDSMKASLQRTDAILNRYFDTEAAPVKTILEQISKMQKTDLKPPMPNISQALNELKSYMLAQKDQPASIENGANEQEQNKTSSQETQEATTL